MADPAVWITGTGPDKQLNFRLPTGGKGDKGDKGDKGADGSNVLPTDTAIATAINGTGPTKTALQGNYVRFVDQNGNPLTNRKVVIKVDSATGEILDIVSEA